MLVLRFFSPTTTPTTTATTTTTKTAMHKASRFHPPRFAMCLLFLNCSSFSALRSGGWSYESSGSSNSVVPAKLLLFFDHWRELLGDFRGAKEASPFSRMTDRRSPAGVDNRFAAGSCAVGLERRVWNRASIASRQGSSVPDAAVRYVRSKVGWLVRLRCSGGTLESESVETAE